MIRTLTGRRHRSQLAVSKRRALDGVLEKIHGIQTTSGRDTTSHGNRKPHPTLRFESMEERVLLAYDVGSSFETPAQPSAVENSEPESGATAITGFTRTSQPIGSVFNASEAGEISAPGETDSFVVSLDPNQSITIVLSTSAALQGSVEVQDSSGVVLGAGSAASAGVNAIVQTAPAITGGDYSIIISGNGGTVGAYELDIILNAAVSGEIYGVADNSTFATSQNLDASFTSPLGTAGERAAVIGRNDLIFSETFPSNTLDPAKWSSQSTATIDDVGLNEPSPALSARLGGSIAGGTVLASTAIDLSGHPSAIIQYSYQRTGGGDSPENGDDLTLEYLDSSSIWRSVSVQSGGGPDLTEFWHESVSLPQDALHDHFHLRFISEGRSGEDDWFVDDISIYPERERWFEVSLNDGQSVSALLEEDARGSWLHELELYDAQQNLIATSDSVFGYGVLIDNFVDPTTNTTPDTYYFRAINPSPEFALIASVDAGIVTRSPGDDHTGATSVFGQLGPYNQNRFDEFAISVNAGDTLVIRTIASFSGLLSPDNTLDPYIALKTPGGGSNVAFDDTGDGEAQIMHAASETGEYLVQIGIKVDADGDYLNVTGEYFAEISGASGEARPLSAWRTTPGFQSRIVGFPDKYVVDFDDTIDERSLDAGDLRINGLPATEVVVVQDSNRYTSLEFTIDPASNVGDGVYNATMVVGAIVDLQGQSFSEAFDSTFTVDTTAPTVVDTSWNGLPFPSSGVLTDGILELTATFSEELYDLTFRRDDIELERVSTAETQPAFHFSYDPQNSVVAADFREPTVDGAYQLRIKSGPSGVQDTLGYELDGEVNSGGDGTPTGDGIAGGDYVVNFHVDAASTIPSNPFERLTPLGGLVSRSAANLGIISSASDEDIFTFDAKAGDRVSAEVLGEALATSMSIELIGSSLTSTSPEPGQAAVLALSTIAADGTYQIRVGANGESPYELRIYNNTALESQVGDSSDGNELPINDSLMKIGGGRFSVVGTSAGMETLPDVDEYTIDLSAHLGQRIDVVLSGIADADFSDEVLELIAPDGTAVAMAVPDPLGVPNTTLHLAIFDHVISDIGNNLYSLRFTSGTPGDYGLLVTSQLTVATEPNDHISDALRDLTESRNAVGYFDSMVSYDPDEYGVGTLLNTAFTGVTLSENVNGDDIYGTIGWFSETSGLHFSPFGGVDIGFQEDRDELRAAFDVTQRFVSISAGARSFPATARLRAYDADDNLLDQVITGSLNGTQRETLAVARDKPEIAYIVATGIASTVATLDKLQTRGVDYYQVTLNSGDLVRVMTDTPLDDPDHTPLNSLDPDLIVIGTDGTTIVADDRNSRDGKNAWLQFTAATSGNYTIGVSAAAGTGEYTLHVDLDSMDFGDAPAPYPTELSQDGARHEVSGPRLGMFADNEFDGQPSKDADGDDATDFNDDDGVQFGLILSTAANASMTLDLQEGSEAKVDAWIDFNQDGDWDDTGEQILSSVNVFTGQQTLPFTVPPGVLVGDTYARVRASTAGGLAPTGFSADGEVEDYLVQISNATPGVKVVESDRSTHLIEGGATDSYEISLDVPPTGTVEVLVSSDPQVEISTDGINFAATALLEFDTTVPQTIIVRAIADGIGEFAHLGVLAHAIVTTADPVIYPTSLDIVSVTAILNDDMGTLVTGFDSINARESGAFHAFQSGSIAASGDVNEFSVLLDPDQTISVVISPAETLQGAIVVRAPDGNILGEIEANAANETVYLQSLPVVDGGLYDIDVSGLAGTTGQYSMRVVLNSALKEEPATPAQQNNTFETSQNIDKSFTQLGGGLASRVAVAVAVAGGTNGSRVFFDDFSSSNFVFDNWAVVHNTTIDSGGISEPSSPLSARFNGNPSGADLLVSRPIDFSTRNAATLRYYYQRTGTGNSTEVNDDLVVRYLNRDLDWIEIDRQLGSGPDMTAYEERSLPLPADAFHSRFQFQIASFGTAGAFDDWFVDDVEVVVPGDGFFSFSVGDGDAFSVGYNATEETNATLELYDSNQNLLATGFPAANFEQVIRRYYDGTTDSLADTYYVRVINPASTYDLLVTRNSDIDSELNDDFISAQDISGVYQSLGHLSQVDTLDYYSVSVSAGDNLNLQTFTPLDGPFDAVNDLNPRLELYAPDGTLLAANDDGAADSRNAFLSHSVTENGEYRIGVSAQDDAIGNYFLSVSFGDVTTADFGDAPSPFPTTLLDNGARHIAAGPTLGTKRDIDADGQPESSALGDDLDGNNDDDGVTFQPIFAGMNDASVTVAAPLGGKLDAWIDFNGDGTFDVSNERIASSQDLLVGDNVVLFDVPPNASSGQPIFARFRVSTAGGLSPRGGAADGEVEDYTLTVLAPPGMGWLPESGEALGSEFGFDVELADFNGDGHLDAFVANRGGPNRVWMGNGSTFTDSGQALGTAHSFDVSLGDINGDGQLDALVVNAFGTPDTVWFGNNGTFTNSGQMLGNGRGIGGELGDLDKDGDLDAFVVNANEPNTVWINEGGVLTNSGQSLGDEESFRVRLGDLDGDGDLDAFVANHGGDSRIWINHRGWFSMGQGLSIPFARSVDLGDLDGDGDLDAFVPRYASNPNQVWLNHDGVFANSGQSLGGSSSFDVKLGDLDGDGDQDAFVANAFDQPNRVWWNHQGTFTDSGQLLGREASFSVDLGDLDGDGDIDAFTANFGQPNRVYLNGGPLDFGDAPDSFGTTIAENGARHVPGGPRLGSLIDTEADGQPTANANGENADGSDDDDGVMFGALATGSTMAGVNIDLQGAVAAKVDAWIDFNQDGDWDDAGEKILDSADVIEGLQTLNYAVPAGIVVGDTFARVRVSADGGLSPTGIAHNGEVEDYVVNASAPPAVESIIVNGGDDQRSQIDSIEVAFDQIVDIDDAASDAFEIVNLATSEVTTEILSISNSSGKTVVGLTFAPDGLSVFGSGRLVDGNYRLTVNASRITSRGIQLDGDENGTPGGNYVFGDEATDNFFRFYGDTDGDRDVDGQDYGRFGLTFLKSTGQSGFDSSLDSDDDGDVDGQDYGRFGLNFLQTLPF